MPFALFRFWHTGKTIKPPSRITIDVGKLPAHIAIIMDGNRRWAARRGLPGAAGHKAGIPALHRIVETCADLGISVLSVYAFSTENWERPADEVSFLLHLLEEVFVNEIHQLHAKDVKVKVLGRWRSLPQSTQRHIEKAEALTAANKSLQLNICLNYGGRADIVDACRAICQKVQAGSLATEAIDDKTVAAHLSTAGQPDPDLLIRTGGDMRISNFLLWQIAYTELYVTPVYWPDFTSEHLRQAIAVYQQRNRRFGKV